MSIIRFRNTEVSSWQSQKADPWSTSPGFFTSRPQFNMEVPGQFSETASKIGEISTAWNMKRANYRSPERYITKAEAETEMERILGDKIPILGTPKYLSRQEAEDALMKRLYGLKIGIVNDQKSLPTIEVNRRSDARGRTALMGYQPTSGTSVPHVDPKIVPYLILLLGTGAAVAISSARRST